LEKIIASVQLTESDVTLLRAILPLAAMMTKNETERENTIDLIRRIHEGKVTFCG